MAVQQLFHVRAEGKPCLSDTYGISRTFPAAPVIAHSRPENSHKPQSDFPIVC
jgi:hypothetical protein